EEAKDPQRDIPRGLAAAVGICSALYMLVLLLLWRMDASSHPAGLDPLATALEDGGSRTGASLIALGAIVILPSTLSGILIGIPRLLFAMSRDGLVPPVFAIVHPRFRTPYLASMIAGIVALLGLYFASALSLAQLASSSMLLSFIIVCAATVYLRFVATSTLRILRYPLLVPACGIALAIALVAALPRTEWIKLLAWILVGVLIYIQRTYTRSRRSVPVDAS